MASLQDVFTRHFPEYVQGRRLHPREWQAASSIARCYTAEAGSHYEVCAAGHAGAEIHHACRHRSCPRCADRARQQWLQAELERLLPCPHFHAVFTLPHEFLPLWEFNRAEMIALLMGSVRDALMAMLADPRHLGAKPGLLLALHTWGRNLSHHPHVHALVSAGGVRGDGTWVATREGYLLPLAPLRRLFAGKLLGQLREQLQQGVLRCPPRQPLSHWRGVISQLYRKHWNIQINPPYCSARGVALYLARYAKGGPLPKDRELLLDHGSVSFEYTDHRDGRRKRQRLDAATFIARILWHAPPKGVHTVRHAGLYAACACRQHGQALLGLQFTRATFDAPVHHLALTPPDLPTTPRVCSRCGGPWQRRIFTRARHVYQISLDSVHRTRPPPPPTVPPGPTQRSSGPPIAGRPPPSRYSRPCAAVY